MLVWIFGYIPGGAFWLTCARWLYIRARSAWRWLRSTPVTVWIGILLFLAILYSVAPKAGAWRFRMSTYVICGLACISMWRRPLAAQWGKSTPDMG